MLSDRLIRLIENHSGDIARRVIRQIRSDPKLERVARLPDLELLGRSERILRDLGQWVAAGKQAPVMREFEDLGRLRFEEHIPLHETVGALVVLRNQIIEFLQEHLLPQTSVDLYAEEELELRVVRFFDELVLHLIRGYEEALKSAAHIV